MNATEEIQKQTYSALMPNLIWNSTVNHDRIWRMFTEGDKCISALPKTDRPALILGSGPSLDRIMPYLHAWDGILIATTSQMVLLRHWNITATYLVVADGRDAIADQMKDCYHYPLLITHPGISPKALKEWEGPLAFFTVATGGDWNQSIIYPWIKVAIQTQGCVTTTQIQIARFLGCPTIILAGVDMAVIDGRNSATNYAPQGFGLDLELPADPRDRAIHDAELAYYHTMLLATWKVQKWPLWQVTPDPGARLRELPQLDIEALFRRPFPPYIPDESIECVVDHRLKQEGVIVHAPVNGIASLEYLDSDSENPPGF